MAIDVTPARDQASLDRAIDALRSGERAWGRTPLATRHALLLETTAAVAREAPAWVAAAAAIKGLDPDSPLVGEEWISGPYALLSYLSALAESIAALTGGDDPPAGHRTGTAPGGRTTVQVLPHGPFDRLLLTGYEAAVWSRPGVGAEELVGSAGLAQRRPEQTYGVALVLGAGNLTSIAPLDVIYQLFAENRVVVLKLNPVLDGLSAVLERVLAPLVARDLVRIVAGGPAEGAYLVDHPTIAAVHVTGSAATHDAIVFGAGADGAARKAAARPRLAKPITSELGGVSPIIVVPGQWSEGDLRFQAEHVATMKLHNSGHNCVAGQIVLLAKAWPQKQRFLDALGLALARAPRRAAWYPGAAARVDAAAEVPGAARVGGCVLVSGLDARDGDEAAFSDEWFAPVLGVAELAGTDARGFLRAAVETANQRLAGTLGANVIADPKTIRALGPAFDEAIAELRYGTIAVNAWTAVGYLTPRATWGAFPGHTLADIQSGRGVVHNALLLADPERTVVRGPFRPRPKPPWFVTNRTAAVTGKRLTAFAAQPRWRSLPAVFASAVRG